MKNILPIVLGVLFVASGALNVVQYSRAKILEEKFSFFEKRFGTYENIKLADEATEKRARTITIYIKPGVPESQILTLKDLLEKQTFIVSTQYTSADQALSDFKNRHQSNPNVSSALNELGANPLGGTITIIITDSVQKESIIDFIKSSNSDSIIANINS